MSPGATTGSRRRGVRSRRRTARAGGRPGPGRRGRRGAATGREVGAHRHPVHPGAGRRRGRRRQGPRRRGSPSPVTGVPARAWSSVERAGAIRGPGPSGRASRRRSRRPARSDQLGRAGSVRAQPQARPRSRSTDAGVRSTASAATGIGPVWRGWVRSGGAPLAGTARTSYVVHRHRGGSRPRSSRAPTWPRGRRGVVGSAESVAVSRSRRRACPVRTREPQRARRGRRRRRRATGAAAPAGCSRALLDARARLAPSLRQAHPRLLPTATVAGRPRGRGERAALSTAETADALGAAGLLAEALVLEQVQHGYADLAARPRGPVDVEELRDHVRPGQDDRLPPVDGGDLGGERVDRRPVTSSP